MAFSVSGTDGVSGVFFVFQCAHRREYMFFLFLDYAAVGKEVQGFLSFAVLKPSMSSARARLSNCICAF